jgi:hypothetical protein
MKKRHFEPHYCAPCKCTTRHEMHQQPSNGVVGSCLRCGVMKFMAKLPKKDEKSD